MKNNFVKKYLNGNSKIIGSILTIGLLILLVGFSYAFFVYNKTGLYTHTITGGKMAVIYNETAGNDITLSNSYPLSDTEALTKGLEFEFTITGYNESDKNIYYAIEMDYGEDLSDKERFKDSDMKLTLYENNKEVFENQIFANLDNQDIYYGIFRSGTSSTSPTVNNYKLRIWINDYVIISDTLNDDITSWSEADVDWFLENYSDIADKMEADGFSSTLLSYYGVSIYTTNEFANKYANFKVNVIADLNYKDAGTLTYDANGGSFNPTSTSLLTGRVTMQKPVMENKAFLGWSSDKKATVPEYKSGEYYTGDGQILYAVYGDNRNVMKSLKSLTDNYEYGITDINEVRFINDSQTNIDERVSNSLYSYDLTKDNQGKVTGWIEEDENYNIVLYIGSEGTIYLTDCYKMFNGWENLYNIDFSNLDTSMVEDMSYMFGGYYEHYEEDGEYYEEWIPGPSLNELNVEALNTKNVVNMSYMFSYSTVSNVSNFDTSNVLNMSHMFENCSVTDEFNLNNFNTSKVTDMSYMFSSFGGDSYGYHYGESSEISLDISSFDTSNVKDMSYMFSQSYSLSSINLSNFNTSNVLNMSYMFYGCSGLNDINLSSFDTSSVINMSYMFGSCNIIILPFDELEFDSVTDMSYMFSESYGNVESINLSNIVISNSVNMSGMFSNRHYLYEVNLGNLTINGDVDMSSMFNECPYIENFNFGNFECSGKVNLSSFLSNSGNFIDSFKVYTENYNMSNVIEMSSMFAYCYNLDYIESNNWNTSQVTNMSSMFISCNSLSSLDLTSFNTSKVTDMSYMFRQCSSLAELDINNFNVENVTNMNEMFYYCQQLSRLDLSNWNTEKLNSVKSIFNHCSNLVSLNVSNWTNTIVTDMSNMFAYCNSLTEINLNNFNTSNVINMESMFYECKSLKNLTLNNFDVRKVTDMSGMFLGCSSLTTLDLSSFYTNSLIEMNALFNECINLTSIDMSNFNTTNVTILAYLFNRNEKLTYVNGLNNFDVRNVTNMSYMFAGCKSFTEINLSNWVTTNLVNMKAMFSGCKMLEKLDLSSFDTSKVTNMSCTFAGHTIYGTTTIVYDHLINLDYIDISNFTFNETLKSNSSNYSSIFWAFPYDATVYVKGTSEQSWIMTQTGAPSSRVIIKTA